MTCDRVERQSMMRTQSKKRIGKLVRLALLSSLLAVLLLPSSAQAEGSADLTENGGGRPFIEWVNETVRNPNSIDWYASPTQSILRQQVVKAYVGVGETVYFGSSYPTANYIAITAPWTKDIGVTSPGGTVTYYDVEQVNNGQGRIQTRAMEVAGPKQLGNAAGYDALSFTVTDPAEAGVYEFRFYTSDNGTSGPQQRGADSWNLQAYCVAAWDITVTNAAGKPVSGRVFADYLALNLVATTSFFNAAVYVLTADGYLYETNFNGLQPDGFLFFANNRGVLNLTTDTSLYHSTLYTDNTMNSLKGNTGFVQTDSGAQMGKDISFRIFFNRPNAAALQYFGLEQPLPPATPKDFLFNAGYSVGKGAGGDFSFFSTAGSSFQIKLEFDENDPNNVVYLSDYCFKGTNTIHWDGLNRYGAAADVGTYKATLTIKGGEYHFPFADAENSTNGINIKLLNPPTPVEPGFNPNMIYYDHSNITVNGEPLTFTNRNDNTHANFTGSLTQIDGTDSSLNGGIGDAMRYRGGFGNFKLSDIWTYFTTAADTATTPVRVADSAAIGELVIRKEVAGVGADSTKPFTFDVTFGSGGTYPYTGNKTGLIKSGEGIALMHGESVTIHDIPENERYTVAEREHDQGGYVTRATGDTGTITHAAASVAIFINTYTTPVTPEEVDIPKTGDDSNLMLYMAIFIAALLGIIIVRILGCKHNAKCRDMRTLHRFN